LRKWRKTANVSREAAKGAKKKIEKDLFVWMTYNALKVLLTQYFHFELFASFAASRENKNHFTSLK